MVTPDNTEFPSPKEGEDIWILIHEEDAPSSTAVEELFTSEINNAERPTSSQVEKSQAAHPSTVPGEGQASTSSSFTNAIPLEDGSKMVNTGSATVDFGASDVNIEKSRGSLSKKPMSTSGSKQCRSCNCKNSSCLKLYCECFKAGFFCQGPCSCKGCLNRPENPDVVQDKRHKIEIRNPNAFAPKFASSAMRRTGCNCKKSLCSKKYCDCYQDKVGCSAECGCKHCQNSYGIKPEKGKSERWRHSHESLYATENRPEHMNSGTTIHLRANSYQFSSDARQSLRRESITDISNLMSISQLEAHQYFPRESITDIRNLMPLSQPSYDATASSDVRNWGGFTGDQIQEANIRPTIYNSLQQTGYPNLPQLNGAHTTIESGMPANILRDNSDNYISPSLHDTSVWRMATSVFGWRRGQQSTRPAIPSFASVAPYANSEDTAKHNGKRKPE